MICSVFACLFVDLCLSSGTKHTINCLKDAWKFRERWASFDGNVLYFAGNKDCLEKKALIFLKWGVIFFGNEAISEWGDLAVNTCGIMI